MVHFPNKITGLFFFSEKRGDIDFTFDDFDLLWLTGGKGGGVALDEENFRSSYGRFQKLSHLSHFALTSLQVDVMSIFRVISCSQ